MIILSNEFTQVYSQVDITLRATPPFTIVSRAKGGIFQGYSAASVYHRGQDRPGPPQRASQAVAVATDQAKLS